MLTFELPDATTSPQEIGEPTMAAGLPLTKTELAPELTLPPWGLSFGRAWGTIPEPTNAIAVPLTNTLDDPELSTVGGAPHAPAVLLPITAALDIETMSLSKILQQSLYNYIDYGARSSKRINDLHEYIGSFLHNPQYEVSLVGRFNRKNVDIVADNVAYEVKLILSSYKKNSHNYLENLIGATTNLQLMGIETVQLIFIPTYLPNFTKSGSLKSIEYLGESHIQMYERLMALDSVVRPSKLIFQVFDTGNLDYLEQHVGTKLNADDLKASYHVQLVTAKNSSVSNFIAQHSFESFIRSLDV